MNSNAESKSGKSLEVRRYPLHALLEEVKMEWELTDTGGRRLIDQREIDQRFIDARNDDRTTGNR